MAASLKLTVEDSSPLITYSPSGAWRDALPLDTGGLAYSGGNFHSTATPGASATINFTGTGISFFGGNRPDYGDFTITVDGNVVTTARASSPGLEINQLLGSASGLTNGPHTAVLTNTGPALDIDHIELQLGAPGSTTTTTVFDDADPAVLYAGDWGTVVNQIHQNSTLHYTQAPGAAASLKFSGNGVAVYGTISPDHADLQFTIDGKMTQVKGGSDYVTTLHPKTLLYYANDLDSSEHTLIFTNPGQQEGTGPFIDLDSISVFSTIGDPNALDGSSAPAFDQSNPSNRQPTNPSSASRKGGLGTGPIIGIVIGILAVLFAVLAVFAFLFLRRRRRRRAQNELDPATPADAELPLQGPNMRQYTPTSAVSPAQPVPTFSRAPSFTRVPARMSRHSIAPSYYGTSNDSRESVSSTTAMIPKVPVLSMPKVPSRAQQTLMVPGDQGPSRPNRPPSLDFRG
jgi:hypothetical protein